MLTCQLFPITRTHIRCKLNCEFSRPTDDLLTSSNTTTKL